MLCNGLHGACRHLHFIGSLKPPRVELRRGGRSSGQLRLPPITEQCSNGQSSDNLMACWLFCLPCPSKVCSTAQWRCWRACGGSSSSCIPALRRLRLPQVLWELLADRNCLTCGGACSQ